LWLGTKGYSHYLNFRSVRGANEDAEQLFDQELHQLEELNEQQQEKSNDPWYCGASFERWSRPQGESNVAGRAC
jgi:hypothetical protein